MKLASSAPRVSGALASVTGRLCGGFGRWCARQRFEVGAESFCHVAEARVSSLSDESATKDFGGFVRDAEGTEARVVVEDPDFTLLQGDVRAVLPTLEPKSIDCALTSPPFYALRDYGVDGQIGLEETPEQWAAELVAVFREVRRLLTPTGTLWVECGETYAGSRCGPAGDGEVGRHVVQTDTFVKSKREGKRWGGGDVAVPGIKAKDIIGAPWLLAFALRADGWYLRQAIIWHKTNAMPESAKDRCTTAHSYVFLLSKNARYHFDSEAIAEPAEWARWGDQSVGKYEGTATSTGWMLPKTKAELVARGGRTTNGQKERTDERRGFDNRLDRVDGMKNPRSVWTIPTQGFPEAHFATWPEALVERIIKAGCPEGGTVLDPFMGSGTTALVARRLGRRSVGVELNSEYAEMAARRLGQQSLLAPGEGAAA